MSSTEARVRTTSRIAMILCVGLLVLAGVASDSWPALAQTPEDCTLPDGVPAPPPPAVTAQQVEDGTGSVMAFTLAARDHLARAEVTVPYVSCLQRAEGSPWRSGSTYIVSLAADGNVFLHSKDMALSGRQLNPLICGSILQALGIDPAELADAAAAQAAFIGATMENGAAFNVPHFPGASGYAAVALSASTFGAPLVVVGGFDLNESHLAKEDFDYGDPAITARDVVDRRTLKAFVTQAGEYLAGVFERDGLAAASKARAILRDENGPWRHGSVYLYILDPVFERILFHAAFPDRFENRPLAPTVRDVVTGKFILTQVMEAAQSGPEGGFVQYYFDDPTDDSDRADIPKVGYARQFVATFEVGGKSIQVPFIMGSGFY